MVAYVQQRGGEKHANIRVAHSCGSMTLIIWKREC